MDATNLVLFCALLLMISALLGFFQQGERTSPIAYILVSAAGFGWVAYSRGRGVQFFGSSNVAVSLLAAILVGVVLGIAGEVYLHSRRKPALSDVLKPMLASPILLLPLYGAVRTIPTYDAADLVWWGLLGFQNGWFWKTALQRQSRQRAVDKW
jgi:uncharacterized membrane protein (UPF0136 family)